MPAGEAGLEVTPEDIVKRTAVPDECHGLARGPASRGSRTAGAEEEERIGYKVGTYHFIYFFHENVRDAQNNCAF